jgi:hypothetical protein
LSHIPIIGDSGDTSFGFVVWLVDVEKTSKTFNRQTIKIKIQNSVVAKPGINAIL